MPKQLIERFFIFRCEPTSKEMSDLLADIDTLLKVLNDRVKAHLLPGKAIETLQQEYDKLRVNIDINAQGGVDKIDGSDWEKVSTERKVELFWEISAIQKALFGLRTPDLSIGWWLLMGLVVILIMSILGYMHYHPAAEERQARQTAYIEEARTSLSELMAGLDRLAAMDVDDAGAKQSRDTSWQRVGKIRAELEEDLKNPVFPFSAGKQLGVLRVDIANKDATAAKVTLATLQQRFEDAVLIYGKDISASHVEIRRDIHKLGDIIKKVNAVPKTEQTKEDKAAWQAVERVYNGLRAKLLELDITAGTEKKLGILEFSKDDEDRDAFQDALKALGKNLDADIENLREPYFYTSTPEKWYEIAVWAWFGVLVGVVFYLSKQLKLGVFDRQDVPSIIGEVVMAPLVTCVVFFLFSLTGITNFVPSEETIIVVLGVAFLFGYAVRRTVGLLENIKQRLLPTP